MERRVALTGASGTGKSTLATFIASTWELELNPVGSRSVSKAMGFASPYDVDAAGQRAEFQRRLVTEKCEWESRANFVTDRTPFDNLVYTMMHDVHSIDPEIMATAINGAMRYTHVIYCPVDSYCDPGTDRARVKERTYHRLFDCALAGLLGRYYPSTLTELLVLQDQTVERRQDRIREFLAT